MRPHPRGLSLRQPDKETARMRLIASSALLATALALAAFVADFTYWP
jgi:hypothetical protein